jgi:lipopolysaccharide biosynthesis protein
VTLRALAFYLPQFHPIPENDRWWGPGFTEWTNVVKARPLFDGHYQPHLPADLGFYDLRLSETREAQAGLAAQHGLSGFCYYHYWFGGKRLLNRPFDEVLQSGRPNFPFCLCWANESWTRRWDGRSGEVIMAQEYSTEDDNAHIEHLIPAFEDERYIRIDGRPLFLVYRTELLPDPARTAAIWRKRASQAGFPDLYLAMVESFTRGVDPRTVGFDAAVEFAPDWHALPRARLRRGPETPPGRALKILGTLGLVSRAYLQNRVYEYQEVAESMLLKPDVSYRRFRCVTPGWDNSPRRKREAVVVHGATPAKYEAWLRAVVALTLRLGAGDEQILFVNAWNEWAEGNHLEPDERWGLAYLEATRRAIVGQRTTAS